MRDDEITRLLAEVNPWWRAGATGTDPAAWVGSNRLLRDRAQYDLGYRTSVLDDVASKPVSDRLVVLTGPRRIGKSVVLLDTAARLCSRSDIDPRQVIYVPCDGFSVRNLRRMFSLARNQTRSVDRQERQRRVWLLDEISMIDGWATVLKSERDISVVGDDAVIATGSRWNEQDDVPGLLLAGRAGTGNSRRLRHVLPMSFRAFVAATRPELAVINSVHPALLQTEVVRDCLEAVRFDVDAYDLAWQAYLTCGGFPRAVAEYEKSGAVSEGYLRDLEAWLKRDVDPAGPQESIPLLLSELTVRATSPLNKKNAAEALGWERRTFDRRRHRLIHSFGALECPQRGDDGRIIENAQPKMYLIDPVLAWLPATLRSGSAVPSMTALTEMALGVCQARAIDNLEAGRWSSGDTIGYSRTASGNEVDLAPVWVPTPSGPAKTTPIEGKWIDGRYRRESMVLERKYGAGLIATKSVLDMDHATWAVPAPLLALLLE